MDENDSRPRGKRNVDHREDKDDRSVMVRDHLARCQEFDFHTFNDQCTGRCIYNKALGRMILAREYELLIHYSISVDNDSSAENSDKKIEFASDRFCT